MEAKEQLLNDLSDSTNKVMEVVNNTPEESFNQSKNGKWSVADHFAHVILLEGLIVKVMMGQTTILEDRKPDDRVKVIRRVFSNLERKLKAGGPINPEPGEKNKDQLTQTFLQYRSQMEELVKQEDLSLICQDFKHAFFKELTRLEWLYFAIIHSDRHAKQMSV